MREVSAWALSLVGWLAGCAGALAADAALIEAAKKEGAVTWYTTQIIDQLARPAADAFEKKYGIKVEYVRADSAAVGLRLINEAQAGKVMADVLDSTSVTLALKERNILLKWLPDSAKHLPKRFSDPEGYWTAASASVQTIGYNSNLVPKGSEPQKFSDLLDSKWKGKLVWGGNNSASGAPGFVGTALAYMGEKDGIAYLEKLSAQKVATLNQSARQVLDQVIAGEYPVALQIYNKHAAISASKGAPSAWTPLETNMAHLVVFAVTREAKRPNAGKLFADFMTSKDGQTIFRNADYLTVDPDVPPLNPELGIDGKHYPVTFFSPEEVEGHMPKWVDIYKRLFP